MWDTMTERVPQHAAGRSPKAREDCLKHPAWCPASTRVSRRGATRVRRPLIRAVEPVLHLLGEQHVAAQLQVAAEEGGRRLEGSGQQAHEPGERHLGGHLWSPDGALGCGAGPAGDAQLPAPHRAVAKPQVVLDHRRAPWRPEGKEAPGHLLEDLGEDGVHAPPGDLVLEGGIVDAGDERRDLRGGGRLRFHRGYLVVVGRTRGITEERWAGHHPGAAAPRTGGPRPPRPAGGGGGPRRATARWCGWWRARGGGGCRPAPAPPP